MSSILTNNSAMVALQTLKLTNMSLDKVQNEISTGKDIASAKDNSAIWAISKVMESDVAGFEAVADSLALGESTVAVALAGAEQITGLLNEIKQKVVAGTGENVDHAKLQADVDALVGQVDSIVSASQFNGMNLLNDDGVDLTVTSSLDRDNAGAVTAGEITVAAIDYVGGMDLTDIDVTDSTASGTSIAAIEVHIQFSVDSAAALGSASKQITDQGIFVGNVIDAMKSGIGALVDADMEAASAKLQALQTQQQLGVQALSIANQAPQTILSLFR